MKKPTYLMYLLKQGVSALALIVIPITTATLMFIIVNNPLAQRLRTLEVELTPFEHKYMSKYLTNQYNIVMSICFFIILILSICFFSWWGEYKRNGERASPLFVTSIMVYTIVMLIIECYVELFHGSSYRRLFLIVRIVGYLAICVLFKMQFLGMPFILGASIGLSIAFAMDFNSTTWKPVEVMQDYPYYESKEYSIYQGVYDGGYPFNGSKLGSGLVFPYALDKNLKFNSQYTIYYLPNTFIVMDCIKEE